MNEKELINACISEDPSAQKELYDRFSDKLYMVCLRYARNKDDANDIFQEGFIRILDNLKQFQFRGSLLGWMNKIMVHTAFSHYRKVNVKNEEPLEEQSNLTYPEPNALDKLTEQEILKVIKELPDGYRVVFNMFAIDGYSHEEIAEKTGITPSTSRSQLARARNLLQKKLKHLMQVIV